MNIENLFTIRLVLENEKAGPQAGLPLATDQAAGRGQSFMDFFLAQISASEQQDDKEQNADKILQSENPLLEEKPKLDLTRLLAENEDIAEEAEAFSAITDEELPHILALNQKAFLEIIKPLQADGSISSDKSDLNTDHQLHEIRLKDLLLLNKNEENLSNEIKAIIEKLQSLAQDNNPQLIVTNLTPEDMSALQKLASDSSVSKNGANADMSLSLQQQKKVENILAGLVSVIDGYKTTQDYDEDTANNASVEKTAHGSADPLLQHNEPNMNEPPFVSAVQAGATQATKQEQAALDPSNNAQASKIASNFSQDIEGMTATGYEKNEGRFDIKNNHTAKDLNAIEPGGKNDKSEAANQNHPQETTQSKTAEKSLPARTSHALNMITGGFNSAFGLSLISSSGDSSEWLLTQGTQGHALNVLQSHTNLIVQNQAATHPHPATQLVAASVKNAGLKGQDTNIALQLDPPDLGKIDVEMRFGKDKSLKTVLTVEKPETLAMLQRDAQILERALQDIGLDTGTDGISFDLAGEGYDFNHNGQHDSHGPHGKSPDKGDNDADIAMIETDLDWYVDPQTGHTHYSILA